VGVLAGIAAYNEAKYMADIVRQALQYVDQVIVVDDGSTDNTAEVARQAGATVVRHTRNRGKGAAVKTILAEARRRHPEVLVLLDADTQHDPNEIPVLVRPIREGFDLVIGSREAQDEKTPPYRRVGRWVLLHTARLASGIRITDSESGFRALSPRAINQLELKADGFAIESEMISCAAHKKLRITEVPITNVYTTDGSTLHPVRHGVDVMSRMVVIISQRRPLFLFGLLGGVLLVGGLIAGITVLTTVLGGGEPALANIILTALLIIGAILAFATGLVLRALARRK
ncbi:MAG: glycosyltransferase family 2 protein, partial [Dehalococcoidia bacterium]